MLDDGKHKQVAFGEINLLTIMKEQLDIFELRNQGIDALITMKKISDYSKELELPGELFNHGITRVILMRKFKKVLMTDENPELAIYKEPTEETFYSLSAKMAETYMDAGVPITTQMKTTIARNYYRMNEGDDADKAEDKFGEIDKLHNLFKVLKQASHEPDADPIKSQDLKNVTIFSIIDLLIEAQLLAQDPARIMEAEDRLQILLSCFNTAVAQPVEQFRISPM